MNKETVTDATEIGLGSEETDEEKIGGRLAAEAAKREETRIGSGEVVVADQEKTGEEGQDKGRIVAEVLRRLDDEFVTERIRKRIEEEGAGKWWKNILSHSLTVLIVGAFLTAGLTDYYTLRQKSLERERAFTDELNKMRVGKIGEVWEKTDAYDRVVRDLIELIRSKPIGNGDSGDRGSINVIKKEDMESFKNGIRQSENSYSELSMLLDRYRFWLDEEIYTITKEYVIATYDHFVELSKTKLESVQDPSKQEKVKELEQKREGARIRFKQIREKMIRGEW